MPKILERAAREWLGPDGKTLERIEALEEENTDLKDRVKALTKDRDVWKDRVHEVARQCREKTGKLEVKIAELQARLEERESIRVRVGAPSEVKVDPLPPSASAKEGAAAPAGFGS